MIRNNRIVVGERNVGTKVRLQTGTYAAFSAPGKYGPKLYWPREAKQILHQFAKEIGSFELDF
jgi:hypothetical protein